MFPFKNFIIAETFIRKSWQKIASSQLFNYKYLRLCSNVLPFVGLNMQTIKVKVIFNLDTLFLTLFLQIKCTARMPSNCRFIQISLTLHNPVFFSVGYWGRHHRHSYDVLLLWFLPKANKGVCLGCYQLMKILSFQNGNVHGYSFVFL